MSRIQRYVLLAFTLFGVAVVFLFGGVGTIAFAAYSSLPGDVLYPLKTTLETVHIALLNDPVSQASLRLKFADRRLLELRSLIEKGRYADLAQADDEFGSNVQQALNSIQNLSQSEPDQALALKDELILLFRNYDEIHLPANFSLVNSDDEEDGEDDQDTISPTSSPETTATSTATPTNTPTLTPTSMSVILPTDTLETMPTLSPTSSVVDGANATCTGFIGAVMVNNLEVPQGASCVLDGTIVKGNILVRNGATLTAQRVRVNGNIQAEGARQVDVLAGSDIGGDIQLKHSGSARVEGVKVNGDIQFESNQGTLIAAFTWVGGNIQVFQNNGDSSISDNSVNGNLQCKENAPMPSGGNNVVQGNKEDQCAGL